jgi:hypothetical protein
MEVTFMSFYSKWETWKITYRPKQDIHTGSLGVAFVEAGDYGHAMRTFREQYEGSYIVVKSCEKLFG